MKVKLSKEAIQQILDDPEKAEAAKVKAKDPWWLIVVKILSYICAAVIAGATTTGSAAAMGIL